MPISDHYKGVIREKALVTIVTSDPAAMRLEGVAKDAAVLQISVGGDRAPAFRWPVEGERWIIARENMDWTLVSRVQDDGMLDTSSGIPGDLLGPDGWILQSDLPIRLRDIDPPNFEFRDENGDWQPYEAPGVAPEIEISNDEPTHPARTVWIDLDEPGIHQQPIQWPPPLVTALPAINDVPDGQEIYFQDTALASLGALWHFRLRKGSASAYKWEFLGGSPLNAEALGGVSVSFGASAWGSWTGTLALTLPLAGDYDVEMVATVSNITSAAQWLMGMRINAADPAYPGTPAAGDAAGFYQAVASGQANLKLRRRLDGRSAGDTIGHRYWHNGTNPSTCNRQAATNRIWPVRVG